VRQKLLSLTNKSLPRLCLLVSKEGWKESAYGVAQAVPMKDFEHKLWTDERGQDIAEYVAMLAVILVISWAQFG